LWRDAVVALYNGCSALVQPRENGKLEVPFWNIKFEVTVRPLFMAGPALKKTYAASRDV
jgi:hypothetical protein